MLPAPQILEAYEEAERVKTLELAGGEAWRVAMTAIAAGYRMATGRHQTADDVHRETERFMLEHISHDKATKIVMPSASRNNSGIQTPSEVVRCTFFNTVPNVYQNESRGNGSRVVRVLNLKWYEMDPLGRLQSLAEMSV